MFAINAKGHLGEFIEEFDKGTLNFSEQERVQLQTSFQHELDILDLPSSDSLSSEEFIPSSDSLSTEEFIRLVSHLFTSILKNKQLVEKLNIPTTNWQNAGMSRLSVWAISDTGPTATESEKQQQEAELSRKVINDVVRMAQDITQKLSNTTPTEKK